MSTDSPTGVVQQILSNVSDLVVASIDSLHKLMTRLGVMQTIDWTTMLLIFWVVFALIVYSVGNILVVVINKRKQINDTKIDDHSNSDTIVKTSVGLDHKNKVLKSNEAIGPDRDCVLWINNIIQWFFSQNDTILKSMFEIWLNSLNNQNRKLSKDNGFSMEFSELCRDKSFTPELSNVMVDKESNDNITVNCKISTKGIKLLVKAFRDNDSVSEEPMLYELHMDRFEGMMKIVCISEEQLFVVRFVERPDFKASLKAIKSLQNHKQKSDHKIVSEDAIINAIINTITKSVVDLCLSGYQDFPRFKRTDQQNSIGFHNSKTIERKLFVKVVKANGLRVNNKEVDEPPQQAHTSTIKNTSSPVWNEHFIFNLKEESTEILFELYDKTNGIVSVNELKLNPSQNQVLKLQPRPLEADQISGSLSVEFLFIEHSSGDTSPDATPISGSPKNTGLGIFEANLFKPNGTVSKNKDVPIIVSSDADECHESIESVETTETPVLDVIAEQIAHKYLFVNHWEHLLRNGPYGPISKEILSIY
ncbi:unnamed protein product [Oppiella nova]|uniref:C2 domain-containing protein n=1 Tax=Oppiella nova TaxID=334625 RepID=A0A7R9QF05_9ACAR|nr:unnamed protein product [Oppiella nova]CAG2163702.1 unnamed protein product [Oppiella nova]